MPEPKIYNLREEQFDRIVGLLFDADLATTNPQLRTERRQIRWDREIEAFRKGPQPFEFADFLKEMFNA